MTSFHIFVAGKPALDYAKSGVGLYLERLGPFAKVQITYIKAGSAQDVSARLLAATEGYYRIALDERGEHWSTQDLVVKARRWQMTAVKRVALLIGASDGHTPELRQACDAVLTLSAFTLQHELALVVLLEQLYRVHTVLANTPYHRA